MGMTDEEAKDVAKEIAEAIPALRDFFSLPREDKVLVAKHLLDMQVGTDATAQVKAIPGLTPEMTETITDPILGIAANAVIGLFNDDGE
jgi:hypothetical protein